MYYAVFEFGLGQAFKKAAISSAAICGKVTLNAQRNWIAQLFCWRGDPNI
jgi:hypothetical protein